MKTSKKYATVRSKDGGRIITIETDGCQLTYDPNIYEHSEHDVEEKGLQDAKKLAAFAWIVDDPKDPFMGFQKKPQPEKQNG